MGKRTRYSAEFKAKVALDAIRGERRLSELAAKHGVQPPRVALEIAPFIMVGETRRGNPRPRRQAAQHLPIGFRQRPISGLKFVILIFAHCSRFSRQGALHSTGRIPQRFQ